MEQTGTGKQDRPTAAAMLWLTALCAVWGLNMVAIKLGNRGIAPASASAFRSAAASLLLMGWLSHRRVRLFHPWPMLRWGLVAGLLFGLEFLFLYLGLARTAASRGMILLYTAPFFISLGAHFTLPGDRLSWRKAAGLCAAFLGAAAVLGQHALSFDAATLEGDLLCLGGAVFWATTTLVIKRHLSGVLEPVQTLHYQLLFSLPVLIPAALILEPAPIRDFSPLTAGSLAFQVLVVCLASYLGWFTLLHRYSAGLLSPFLFLGPVMGVAAGALFLGEPVPPTLLLGLAGVGLGIWLVNRGT
jgi:drug/metabolite transporter (DMT)-like permease